MNDRGHYLAIGEPTDVEIDRVVLHVAWGLHLLLGALIIQLTNSCSFTFENSHYNEQHRGIADTSLLIGGYCLTY